MSLQPQKPDSETQSASAATTGASAVPPGFGAKGGPTISNKDSVLEDVDDCVNGGQPPAVEYLLVRPFSVFRIPFTNLGLCFNVYG